MHRAPLPLDSDSNKDVLRKWPYPRARCTRRYPRGEPRHSALGAMLDPLLGRLTSKQVADMRWDSLKPYCRRDP